jgi:hypothetical protein
MTMEYTVTIPKNADSSQWYNIDWAISQALTDLHKTIPFEPKQQQFLFYQIRVPLHTAFFQTFVDRSDFSDLVNIVLKTTHSQIEVFMTDVRQDSENYEHAFKDYNDYFWLDKKRIKGRFALLGSSKGRSAYHYFDPQYPGKPVLFYLKRQLVISKEEQDALKALIPS